MTTHASCPVSPLLCVHSDFSPKINKSVTIPPMFQSWRKLFKMVKLYIWHKQQSESQLLCVCCVLQGCLRKGRVCPAQTRSFTPVISAAPAMRASTARSQVRELSLLRLTQTLPLKKHVFTRCWPVMTPCNIGSYCSPLLSSSSRLQHSSLSLLQPDWPQSPQEPVLQQQRLLWARPPLPAASLHPHRTAPASDSNQTRETSSTLCSSPHVQPILQVDPRTLSTKHLSLSGVDLTVKHVWTPPRW